MNKIHELGRHEYVISDPESDRQVMCDSPTDVALAVRAPEHTFPPDDGGTDENSAKFRLVIMMMQYPECEQLIRSMFWRLTDRGESIVATSEIIVAEMKKRRPAIIAAREAPQQQVLDDIRAQRARIREETAQIQAEGVQIQAENARMDRIRDCVVYGVPVVGLAALGGWIAGVAGAIGGGVAGFLPQSLYRRFLGDSQQDPV
jgi:hypothetical protein